MTNLLVATVLETGNLYVVRYDLRHSFDRTTHKAISDDGSVRCWGPLLRTKRGGGHMFSNGKESIYPADRMTVEELSRTANTIRNLCLAPCSSWRR